VTAAILLRQLRHHAPLLVAALAGAFGFELLMVWVSSSMVMGTELQELMSAVLPPAMVNLVMNQYGLASFPAAVAFGFKHPFVIAAGVAVVITMASVPAGERETGFLDLILARPVTRGTYMGAHIALLLVPAIAFPIVLFVAANVGIAISGRSDAAGTDYVLSAAAFAPLLLFIGAYTLLFAAGAQRRGTAVARAVALTMAFYVYEVIASMWERLHGWEWLTIFDAYRPVGLVTGDATTTAPLVLLGAAGVLLGCAALRFARA
jgi:ABC-2 type transport system permease protein